MAEFYLYRPPEYVLRYIYGEREKNVIVQFIDDSVSSYAVVGPLTKQFVTSLSKYPKNVVINNVVSGDRVTDIDIEAFKDQYWLQQITIGSDVSAVHTSAFMNCNALTDVIFQGRISKIDDFTFAGCTSLTQFAFPDGLSSIGNDAFSGCIRLGPAFSIPSVSYLGQRAFRDCVGLTSVSISNGISAIEQDTFCGCVNLENLPVLPESVKTLKSGSFRKCTSFVNLQVPDSIQRIEAGTFCECSSIVSMTLPFIGLERGNNAVSSAMFGSIFGSGSVWHGGYNIVQYYTDNTTVTVRGVSFVLPQSLKSVTITDETLMGFGAFTNCTELTSIYIPNTVTWCGGGSNFNGCSSLVDLTLPFVGSSKGQTPDDPFTRLFGHVFGPQRYGGSYQVSQYYESGKYYSYYVPSSLKTVSITDDTHLGGNAFQSMTSLTAINLPRSTLTAINEYAFWSCTGLRRMIIPDSVSSLGQYALSACTELTGVYMSNNVETIQTGTFMDCSKMKAFSYGEGIRHVKARAFKNCASLPGWHANLYKSIGDEAFANCFSLKTVVFGDSLSSIGDYAFSYCTSLTGIALYNSLKTLGVCAFQYNTAMQTASIGGNSLSIGNNAFRNCTGLKSVYWQSSCSLNKIDSYAFANCGSLQSLAAFPSQLTSIGAYAFVYDSALTSVNAGNCSNLKSIGSYAFNSCTSLKSVTMPYNALKVVNPYTYANCTSLQAFTGNESISVIGDHAFYNCTSLAANSNWHFMPSLRTIDTYAFANSGIKGIVVDSGVQYIAECAFESCPNLTGVTLPDTVTYLGSRAFCNCKAMRTANVGSGLTTIQSETFLSCTSLNRIDSRNITSIGDGAFSHCNLRGDVKFQDSLVSIGAWAFYYNFNMKHFLSYSDYEAVPAKLSQIGTGAFSTCTSLLFFTFASAPATRIDIGDRAFEYCYSLDHIGWSQHLYPPTLGGAPMVPDSVHSIGANAFYHCRVLRNMTFGPGIYPRLVIGPNAYAECISLYALNIFNKTRQQITEMAYYPWGITVPQIIHGSNY